MLAQIIFFLALALFLVLLARRSTRSAQLLDSLGSTAVSLGRSVGRIGSSAGSSIMSQARSIKGRIPLVSDRSDSSVINTDGHAFWNEETAENAAGLNGYFDEGDELFKQGKYAEAEEFFLKAATRNPSDALVYARLGVIYLHQKNFNDAIESLKVAVKCDKYNPSRHYNLALAYLGNNDRQKALTCVREAIVLDPVTKKYRQLLEQLLDRK